MQVKIGNFGIITIGHKTKMGDVAQVIEMGNKIRKDKGLNELPLDNILEKQALWEFIISRNNQKAKNSNSPESGELKNSQYSDYSELLEYKNSSGKIQYGKLMKKYPLFNIRYLIVRVR